MSAPLAGVGCQLVRVISNAKAAMKETTAVVACWCSLAPRAIRSSRGLLAGFGGFASKLGDIATWIDAKQRRTEARCYFTSLSTLRSSTRSPQRLCA